jgi:hypothetical protein
MDETAEQCLLWLIPPLAPIVTLFLCFTSYDPKSREQKLKNSRWKAAHCPHCELESDLYGGQKRQLGQREKLRMNHSFDQFLQQLYPRPVRPLPAPVKEKPKEEERPAPPRAETPIAPIVENPPAEAEPTPPEDEQTAPESHQNPGRWGRAATYARWAGEKARRAAPYARNAGVALAGAGAAWGGNFFKQRYFG